jgi:DNA polymerase I-like protein with 3'-5' exonuclease and polymerase domains
MLFWEEAPERVRGQRRETAAVMPPIPETGWKPLQLWELPDLRHASAIALDTETYDPGLTDHGPGWARGQGWIVGVSLAVDGFKTYVPIRHEMNPEMNLPVANVVSWLQHCLGGDGGKVGANLGYDLGWLRTDGVEVAGKLYDVQIAEALINETSKLSLDDIGHKYLRRGKVSDDLEQWARLYYLTNSKNWRKDIYRCPLALVGPYAEGDAEMPLSIIKKQWPILARYSGLLDIFDMENELIRCLHEMRWRGVPVDIPYAEQAERELQDLEDAENAAMAAMVGEPVEINKSNSLARAFDKLGLPYEYTAPSERHPNGQPSFTKDFIATVKHPIGDHIRGSKEANKLRGTFVRNYILNGHVNGTVFGQFHLTSSEQGGTRTGRFSSSTPNLQNIPKRSKLAKMLRKMFIPEHGQEWVKIDYSQIEYRLLAHMAVGPGAEEIRRRYNEDPKTDYHQAMIELVYSMTGIMLEREPIKNFNFGMLYGMGVPHLAEMLKLSIEEARPLAKQYHEGAPFVRATMDMISKEAAETGVITTIMGRRSHFDEWEPDWYGQGGFTLPYAAALEEWGANIRRAKTYAATNYRIQGSAADLMKKAMYTCHVDGSFRATGYPHLTVHDELDFSGNRSREWLEAFAHVRHVMENVIPFSIPILAEPEMGPNWGECTTFSKLGLAA